MTVSKKQQACVARYTAAHYDRVNLFMDKGKRDEIKTAAAEAGQSVNAYINQAIAERMESKDETKE